MLRHESIGGFPVWEYIDCPLCGSTSFVSHDNCCVTCDTCDMEFRTRYTAGDAGCVVDAFLKTAYSLFTGCLSPHFVKHLKDYKEELLEGLLYRREMYREYKGINRPPEDIQKQLYIYDQQWTRYLEETVIFCRILKTGDRDGGWSVFSGKPGDHNVHTKWPSSDERWFDWLRSLEMPHGYVIGYLEKEHGHHSNEYMEAESLPLCKTWAALERCKQGLMSKDSLLNVFRNDDYEGYKAMEANFEKKSG